MSSQSHPPEPTITCVVCHGELPEGTHYCVACGVAYDREVYAKQMNSVSEIRRRRAILNGFADFAHLIFCFRLRF